MPPASDIDDSDSDSNTGAPLGLSVLQDLRTVLVGQKLSGVKSKNAVFSVDERILFYAREQGSLAVKMFRGSHRSFELDIVDLEDNVVAKLRRPFTLGTVRMEVQIDGELRFMVRKKLRVMKRVMKIYDTNAKFLYDAKGPTFSRRNAEFEIRDSHKRRVGVIQKKWGGPFRELATIVDWFLIHFPRNLPVDHKMAIIATCFLIDFLFYEKYMYSYDD